MQVPRTGRNHVPICCRQIFTKIYSIWKSQGKSADLFIVFKQQVHARDLEMFDVVGHLLR